MNDYDDIIHMKHHVSAKRPQMSMASRASQFASFKALTGFEEDIDETARLTDKPPELNEEQENKLNQMFLLLEKIGADRPFISVTYFIPDTKKSGGKYVTVKGNFRVLDFDTLKFTNGKEIPVRDIFDIRISEKNAP